MIDKITFAFALGGSQGGDGRARRSILSESPLGGPRPGWVEVMRGGLAIAQFGRPST